MSPRGGQMPFAVVVLGQGGNARSKALGPFWALADAGALSALPWLPPDAAGPHRRGNPAGRLPRRPRGRPRALAREALHSPVDQFRVEGRHQRALSTRTINVRGVWDAAVDAWVDGDEHGLDAIWDDIITGLGSDWDAYANVSSGGWAA
jgi:hypothetical protein